MLQTGRAKPPQDVDNLARWPCLHSWFRTSTAIVLFLNNGTLQVFAYVAYDIKLYFDN